MRSLFRRFRTLLLMAALVTALAGIESANAGQRRTLYRCANCNAESYGEEGLRGFCPGVKRPPGARMADPLHNWQPVEPDRPVVRQPPPPPPPDQRTLFVCSECGRRTLNPTALSEDCPSRMGASRFDRGHRWAGQAPTLDLLDMLNRDELKLVVVDDLSRLTRDKDYGLLWDRMVARGCRFISVLDCLDSTRDGDEMSAMIKGLMNNVTNKIHGKRVRRGIVGRFLDPKGSAGLHPYGYVSRFSDPDAAANYKGVGPKPKKDLFIDEEQAAVIREIYRLYGEEE